ncbi:MAG: TlpA family protein disulfide reductase [Siculibacillus sp.]|nr:TlpA family protein disulfide reductase [Siculibacillus sp.]
MRGIALALTLLAATPAVAADLVESAPKPVSIIVQDRDGRDLAPSALGGRLTLVHFWASWCGTCRTEFPAIDALQKDMREEGVRVAAVSLDRLGWPAIDRTATALELREVTLLHDRNREAAQKLAVPGLPTTVVLDAAGREVARLVGAGDWEDEGLRARLRQLAGK